jgi:hypothetical protein
MDAMQLHDLAQRMLDKMSVDISTYRNEKLAELRETHPDEANVIVIAERNKLILEITAMRETALKAYEFISDEAARMRNIEMTGSAPDKTKALYIVTNSSKPW